MKCFGKEGMRLELTVRRVESSKRVATNAPEKKMRRKKRRRREDRWEDLLAVKRGRQIVSLICL